MGYQSIEDLLSKADGSVYKLVRMASNRATELAEGKPRLIEKSASDKETSIALEEILQGKVISKTSAENLLKKNNKDKK